MFVNVNKCVKLLEIETGESGKINKSLLMTGVLILESAICKLTMLQNQISQIF